MPFSFEITGVKMSDQVEEVTGGSTSAPERHDGKRMILRLSQAARAVLGYARRRHATALEYAGIALIVYGVHLISEPAAWIVAGGLLVVEALTTAVR